MDMHLGSFGHATNCRRLRIVSPVPSSPSVRPKTDPVRTGAVARKVVVTRSPQSVQAGASVDHWTMVLFYAMGVGALALMALFFLALLAVGLYGQFVWSFTQWDLSSIRSAAVKPWAHFTLWAVFAAGTGVGVWFFGGYAWKNLNVRISNAATRRQR